MSKQWVIYISENGLEWKLPWTGDLDESSFWFRQHTFENQLDAIAEVMRVYNSAFNPIRAGQWAVVIRTREIVEEDLFFFGALNLFSTQQKEFNTADHDRKLKESVNEWRRANMSNRGVSSSSVGTLEETKVKLQERLEELQEQNQKSEPPKPRPAGNPPGGINPYQLGDWD